jgi:histone H3/H4
MDLPKPVATIAAKDDHESILGQFIYAFGQGAGTVRVSRRAIAALRARYLGPVQAYAGRWETTAAYVLPLLAQVGRLAALLATQAGRSAIAETDFTRARRLVEARTHEQAEASGQLMAGPLCPPISGEPAVLAERSSQDDTPESVWLFSLRPDVDSGSPTSPIQPRSQAH